MGTDPQWKKRWQRLSSMSWLEFQDRARQTATARLDAWRYTRGYDFAEPTAATQLSQAGRFFFQREEVPWLCAAIHRVMPTQVDQIVQQAEKVCRHQFDLLGFRGLDYGAEIDWHLDAVHGKRAARKPWAQVKYLDFQEVGDAKITWELNRHQHLVALAKAYRLSDDPRFVRECLAQWKHWQQQNPYPIGINWASSLEVAFRTLSWIWVYFLLADTEEFNEQVQREWLQALSLSGRHVETYLSKYFSPNTHLLGEAVALFFLGTLFPGLRSAARWKHVGWEVVLTESAKQVRDDGFYFEQSTYYHVYALDLLLHFRILAATNGVVIPPDFDKTLIRMLDALLLLSRAGVPPSIGDDDGGRLFDPRRNRLEHLLDPLSTGAALFGRGDYKFMAGLPREETLWLLGTAGLENFEKLESNPPSSPSVGMSCSGLYLMADAALGQQLFIDAGPQGPNTAGHGHADALSIWLAGAGRVLLGDSGALEYAGTGPDRAQLRGTAAHNTLQVDGQDQAVATGPFSWRDLPDLKTEAWITAAHFNFFRGSHDGYTRFESPVIHRRTVFHRKGQFWFVQDVADGSGPHQIGLTWNIGPTLAPAGSRDDWFADDQGGIFLGTVEEHGWAQRVQKEDWSPAYGERQPRLVLRLETEQKLPVDFATLVLPTAHATDGRELPRLQQLGINQQAVGYRFTWKNEEHNLFFAKKPSHWALGQWTSDAEFLYWVQDRNSDQRLMIVCNVSYVEAGGLRLLSSGGPVRYAEVAVGRGGTRISSSNSDALKVAQGIIDFGIEVQTASEARG